MLTTCGFLPDDGACYQMAGHLPDMLPNSLFRHLQGDFKRIIAKWLKIYQMIGARSEMVYTFIR
jgi:hypothetical protein